MTILVCHNHYALRAGEDHAVAAECGLLRAAGHTVVSYTRDNAEIAAWPWWRRILAVCAAFHNPRTAREIARLAAQTRPDVAHVHNVFPLISPSIYRSLRRAGVPIVQTAHNFRCVCANGLLFRDGRICHDCLEGHYAACVRARCFRESRAASLWYTLIIWWHRRRRTLARHVHRVIALNTFSRALLVRAGFDQQRITVLPNCADSGNAGMVDVPDEYVLYVGRLSDEKGIMTVMRAAARVPDIPIKIAGSGPRASDVRAFIAAHALRNVTLLGQLGAGEVQQVIARALALVFASECYENCPLVVINALYAGTPVIAARTGGVPEFVPDGTAGWLFTPGHDDELAARVRWLFAHQAAVIAMRPGVRAWGRTQFAPDRHAAQLCAVYAEAIAAAQEG